MKDTKMKQPKAGRPTVITAEVVNILVGCFRNGMTVREACWQSGISHEAYYNHLRNNQQFVDIIARAQANPTMTARRVLVDAINNSDVSAAKWWLERKAADEFGSSPKPVLADDTEKPRNRFADMSDEDMNKLGVELSQLIVKSRDTA